MAIIGPVTNPSKPPKILDKKRLPPAPNSISNIIANINDAIKITKPSINNAEKICHQKPLVNFQLRLRALVALRFSIITA